MQHASCIFPLSVPNKAAAGQGSLLRDLERRSVLANSIEWQSAYTGKGSVPFLYQELVRSH